MHTYCTPVYSVHAYLIVYTDHSNTACTKSSNMRHAFNTLQPTVACDTADMCSAACIEYAFSCLQCTSSLPAILLYVHGVLITQLIARYIYDLFSYCMLFLPFVFCVYICNLHGPNVPVLLVCHSRLLVATVHSLHTPLCYSAASTGILNWLINLDPACTACDRACL